MVAKRRITEILTIYYNVDNCNIRIIRKMFGVVNTMLHTACNIFFKVRYQPPIDSGCAKLKPYIYM